MYGRCAHGAGGGRHALKFLQPLRAKQPRTLPLTLLVGHAHTLTARAACHTPACPHSLADTCLFPRARSNGMVCCAMHLALLCAMSMQRSGGWGR